MDKIVLKALKHLPTLGIIVFILPLVLNVGVYGQAAQNWTGDGGKEMSIVILAPNAIGLTENQSYIPVLIQGEFVNNFSSYSAISRTESMPYTLYYSNHIKHGKINYNNETVALSVETYLSGSACELQA